MPTGDVELSWNGKRVTVALSTSQGSSGLDALSERLDSTNWHARAACRALPADLFYEPENFDQARLRCAGCEVQTSCLLHALRHREQWGVWGGLDPGERRKLLVQIRARQRDES